MGTEQRSFVIAPLLASLLSACAATGQKPRVFVRPDGVKVRCFEPRTVIPTGFKAEATAKAKETIERELKAGVDVKTTVERIRADPSAAVIDFEWLNFYLCTSYGNGVFSKEQYASLTVDLLSRVSSSSRTPAPPPWQVANIESAEKAWKADWRDISSIGSLGWLGGVVEEGGGSGYVGRGILLQTTDSGRTWSEVSKDRFKSGKGQFTWGPQGTRLYTWDEVGPIKALLFYRRQVEAQHYRVEGWLASSTGVYTTQDAGASWTRSTPPPDHPERYAFFGALADIEGFSQIYAVGWQGIAHWSSSSAVWRLQKATYSYAINGIAVGGLSEIRTVWAVGQSEPTDKGYRGTLYRYNPSASSWETVSVGDVSIGPNQSFQDILVPEPSTVFIVGNEGLILRGRQDDNGQWKWTIRPSPEKATLYSIASHDGKLWAVGEKGVILFSNDQGESWKTLPNVEVGGARATLRRVRFSGGDGWVVGDRVVVKLNPSSTGDTSIIR